MGVKLFGLIAFIFLAICFTVFFRGFIWGFLVKSKKRIEDEVLIDKNGKE